MPSPINLGLVLLSPIAAFGMVATSGEPVFKPLRGTTLEPILLSLGWSNTVVFNLCAGYLVSLFFWFLVVFLPERQRRQLLKNHLQQRYQAFKEEIVQTLLWASIGAHDSRLPRELTDYKKFTAFFTDEERKRWYAALNGIQDSPERMQEVALAMQMLHDEVAYILNNVAIEDPRAHEFLKLLNENIYRLRHSDADLYDQVKYVGGFLWSILGRWSMLKGQLENDPLAEIIDRI